MTKFVVRNSNAKKSSVRFPHKSLRKRLINDGAIDMRGNHQIVEGEDDYVKVIPIDEMKLYE